MDLGEVLQSLEQATPRVATGRRQRAEAAAWLLCRTAAAADLPSAGRSPCWQHDARRGTVPTSLVDWAGASRGVGSSGGPVLTPRLALAAVGLDDVDDLVQLYADPEVGRWTGPWNRASVQDWAHSMSVRWAEDGVGKWMAYERATGSLVGRGGFTRIVLEAEPVLELGWVIHDALTGHGYATELGRAALDWAAQHWPALPIVAFTELHNYASRAVMERLGMLFTRVIWREGLMEGHLGLHPDAPFALYRG